MPAPVGLLKGFMKERSIEGDALGTVIYRIAKPDLAISRPAGNPEGVHTKQSRDKKKSRQ